MNSDLLSNEMVLEAKTFAIAAHEAVGQKRKYTGEPYWLHPLNVAAIVSDTPRATPELVAAAWLHDVVEDTAISNDLIWSHFGYRVADIVAGVTDIAEPQDGNRKKRKAMERDHLAQGDADIHTLKLADMIDNTASITVYDPKFAKVYMREKALMLTVLKLGDPTLLKRAGERVLRYFADQETAKRYSDQAMQSLEIFA